MKTRFVKPGEGRRVRVPFAGNALVPEAGMAWPANDPFLQRRLVDRDLVDADEAVAPESIEASPDPASNAAPSDPAEGPALDALTA